MKWILAIISIVIIFNINNLTAQNLPIYAVDGTEVVKNGKIWYSGNDFSRAIREFASVHPLDSAYNEARFRLALSYYAQKQNDSTISICVIEVKKQLNAWKFEQYKLWGNACQQKNDLKQAARAYWLATRDFPNSYFLFYNRGLVLLKINEYENAKRCFQNAVSLFPNHQPSHYELAKLYRDEGKIIPAMFAYEFCITLNPLDTLAKLSLIELEQLANRETITQPRPSGTEQGDFSKIEREWLSQNATKIGFKSRYKLSFTILQQTDMVLKRLSEVEVDTGFAKRFYLPFYLNVEDKGMNEVFGYNLYRSSTDEKVVKLLKKYASDYRNFKRLLPLWINATAMINIPSDSGYKCVRLWTLPDGQLIGGGEKIGESKVGYWRHFHTNFTIESEGLFEKGGVKIGIWKYYSDEGYLKSVMNYKANKIDGEAVNYYDDGKKKRLVNYERGMQMGEAKEYYRNGQLAGITMYAQNYKNGKSETYYPSGFLYSKMNYNLDNLDGFYEVFYPNGKLKFRTRYQSGLQQDSVISYYPNGAIQYTGFYSSGKKSLSWYFYDSVGIIIKVENYLQDNKDGEMRLYFANGQIRWRGYYSRNQLHSTAMEYNELGKKITEYEYQQDKLIAFIIYDSAGNYQARNTPGIDPAYKFIRKNGDGKIREQGTFNAGKKNGEWKWFYENERVMQSAEYKDNELNGRLIQYYENGKIKLVNTYRQGQLEGLGQRYYPDGKLQAQFYHRANQIVGLYQSFYPNGQLASSVYYNNKGIAVNISKFYQVDGSLDYVTGYDPEGCPMYLLSYPIGGGKPDSILFQEGNAVFKQYYADNTLFMIGKYEKYSREGEWRLYAPNGMVLSVVDMRRGEPHGRFISYYPSGSLQMEGQYLYGKQELLWREFYENGVINSSGRYAKGVKDGKWAHFHQDGNKDKDLNYSMGVLDGSIKLYSADADADVQIILYYSQGKLIRYGYYESNGNIKKESVDNKAFKRVIGYYKDGTKSFEGDFELGVANGVLRRYHFDGMLMQIEENYYGYRHGSCVDFTSDSVKVMVSNYYYGLLHNERLMFTNKGGLRERVSYMYGVRDGETGLFHAESQAKVKRYIYKGGCLMKMESMNP